jgi:hypothetical protein
MRNAECGVESTGAEKFESSSVRWRGVAFVVGGWVSGRAWDLLLGRRPTGGFSLFEARRDGTMIVVGLAGYRDIECMERKDDIVGSATGCASCR